MKLFWETGLACWHRHKTQISHLPWIKKKKCIQPNKFILFVFRCSHKKIIATTQEKVWGQESLEERVDKFCANASFDRRPCSCRSTCAADGHQGNTRRPFPGRCIDGVLTASGSCVFISIFSLSFSISFCLSFSSFFLFFFCLNSQCCLTIWCSMFRWFTFVSKWHVFIFFKKKKIKPCLPQWALNRPTESPML